MGPEDRPAFATAFLGLCEVFNTPVSDLRMEAYFEALSDLAIGQVQVAIGKTIGELRFFPKPVEIREAVLGSKTDHAVKAWDRLLLSVRRHGPYASVNFQDPVLHTAIEALGGWHVIAANLPEDPNQLGYRRTEFLQSYRAYQQSIPGPARPYLPGLAEIANTSSRGSWANETEFLDTVLVIGEDGAAVVQRMLVAGTPTAPPPEQIAAEAMREEIQKLAALAGDDDQTRSAAQRRRDAIARETIQFFETQRRADETAPADRGGIA